MSVNLRRNRAAFVLRHAAVLLGSLLVLTAPPAAAASVQDGYTVPVITVPYAFRKPTMDGMIRDDEWKNAASLNALQTTNHAVSARQTQFWMLWDEDHIYLAMRSPLRPGERVIQALRERDHDVNVVFDDSYEIWLGMGTHSPDGQPALFQYLSNFAGARYDVMQEPAVGNSRLSWTAHWNPQNRLTPDGHAWEMELTIPRRSVYKDTPFADGFSFGGLLTRNYKRPWDQNSVSGSGSFSVPDTYARFVLSKTAPAVQLLSVGNPETQKFGVQLAAAGTQPQTLKWQFRSDSGVQKQGDLTVQPGQQTTIPAQRDLDSPGSGAYRITVTSDDGKTTYLDWSAQRQWSDLSALTQQIHDTGDQVVLTLGFNPVRNSLRANGDLIDFDDRAKIARYDLTVTDKNGKLLARKLLHLDSLAYVRDVVQLPDLPPGSYTAKLTATDAAGATVFTRDSAFTKKDPAQFAWWNTKTGNADKVLSPWTPVTYSHGRFGVWGRTMQTGAAGLPAQVVAQGRPLLAQPASLVADFSGKAVRAVDTATKTVSSTDYRVVTQSIGRLGPVAISSTVTTEFDGMYKVALTLTPSAPTSIRRLRVIVPLRNDVANYLHACGEGIRYGFDYRFLPNGKQGRLWSSQSIDGQPMLVGSFIPYLWIGDTRGGLCWFADSDEGWNPDNATPALEVRRDTPGSTDLVLNLIGKPAMLSKPRTITFAFQATPVKPLQPNWRMDTWWTNDSFQDWAQVESEGHAGAEGLIFSSIPFPLDPAKSRQMVEARHQQTNDVIFGFKKYRANAVPYFEHINMGDQFVPELGYFGDEWRTHVSRGLAYGETLSDFMVYHVGQWAKDSDIDGFYIDNVAPIADDNVQAGRGYLLPDGRVQPAYQMFDTRTYLLRMRAALAEQGKQGKFVLHITNHMIAPWIGAADIALDGEDHVIYPEMHKDFMDFWSLERLRLDNPREWGTAVNFLQEYQGSWDHDALKTAMRAYTGMMLLDDTLASANANGLNPELWQARERFGIEAGDVRFLRYGADGSGLTSATPGVYVSGWLRPDGSGAAKALIAVVNTGEATHAAVVIDPHLLELPSGWSVTDAETQQAIAVPSAGGALTIAIPRHDYRLLLIESPNIPIKNASR